MAAVVMAMAAGQALAQSSVARVSNDARGYYYANSTLDISIADTQVGSYNSTQYFINAYSSNFGNSASAVPAPAVISQNSAGNILTSPVSVSIDARAGTSWGANHTYASISGFENINTSNSTTLCPTIPGSAQCIPGLPEQTQTLTSYNYAYAYSDSRWEEIYLTGGGSGALSTTFNVHVSLGAQSNASGTAVGNAYFSWAERDFYGNNIAYFSASYSAASDSWWASSYSNVNNEYHDYAGNGSFSIGDQANPSSITSWDGYSFNGSLTGQRAFAIGDVVYIDSFAQSYVDGNGIADAENTVTLTNLVVPTGVRLLATSGTDYGGVVAGGGGGVLCSTSECVVGSGGGGVTPSVPEPQTYALLLAGLGVIGLKARRRRAR